MHALPPALNVILYKPNHKTNPVSQQSTKISTTHKPKPIDINITKYKSLSLTSANKHQTNAPSQHSPEEVQTTSTASTPPHLLPISSYIYQHQEGRPIFPSLQLQGSHLSLFSHQLRSQDKEEAGSCLAWPYMIRCPI